MLAGSGPASPDGAHVYRRTLSQRGSLGSGGVGGGGEHREGYGYNSEWAAEDQRFRRSPSNASRSPLPSTVRATSPRRTSRDLHIAAATLAKELSDRMHNAAGGYGGGMDEGPLQVNETGGAALEPAWKALYGRHRPVSNRLIWILPPEHDPRVFGRLDWIDRQAWGLCTYGVQRFLASRGRGALITNADYQSEPFSLEPTFDWITFEDVQGTDDKLLQESIACYNPATTVLVFVILVSKSRNSVGIWRRKLRIPHNISELYYSQIEDLKRELLQRKYIVMVEPGSSQASSTTAHNISPTNNAPPALGASLRRKPVPAYNHDDLKPAVFAPAPVLTTSTRTPALKKRRFGWIRWGKKDKKTLKKHRD
ncbi:hypothetical protein BOTBODRAFT_30817 [Botryobasidium botryosum FD-172 SS1]|uniref:CcmS related domain-containing protein n=1 Tax=Botryobasidium botryosum (strain FD-172 SS1) TaxID=930990 RepID=A0A067MX72_BOTB1|nr:hypothetical protein BOTBODRAFT_30817 [Botryobasidium botryosum FD-172 SS1]